VPVLHNISLLARCLPDGGQGDIHPVPDAALVWEGGRIAWAGPRADLPAEYAGAPGEDAGGRLVIPGLVDCHTHLGFGGWRADEFALRLLGRDYRELLAKGGGILSTMRSTRELSREALVARSEGFLREMVQLGVTCVEAKSGYGLDRETELRQLEAYAILRDRGPQRIVATLLAAHVVPPEYRDRREAYLRLIAGELIPAVAERGLARFCDVFVEAGAFTVAEAEQVFTAARAHGLGAKVHADQLSAGGGAELAARVGAVSADHLEHVSEAGIAALAAAGVVAVSLPLATLYLGVRPLPARALIAAGVPVAVATDFNPGSAPSYHLPLALMLACTLQRMTPAEALKGATTIAARALGVQDQCGALAPGMAADFAIIDAPDVDHWLYHFRANACVRTVIGGHTVWEASA
jgi:imidazolonepropionase